MTLNAAKKEKPGFDTGQQNSRRLNAESYSSNISNNQDAIVQEFRTKALEAGFRLPDALKADGAFHPCGVGKLNKLRYSLRIDGIPTATIWDWSLGHSVFEWRANGARLTDAEIEALKAEAEKTKASREAESEHAHAAAARTAGVLWASAKPASEDHPYLQRKGVKAHCLKQDASGRLLVPMYANGKLVNLQFIAPDGSKRFMKGGQTKGAHFIAGVLQGETLCICEGVATAISIYEATGFPCIAALSATNLLSVAREFESFPGTTIVCADNDWSRDENIGLIRATEAARETGSKLAVPDFGEHRGERDTDFNDLFRLHGSAAVRRCVEDAEFVKPAPKEENPPDEPPHDADEGEAPNSEAGEDGAFRQVDIMALAKTEAPPRKWVVQDIIPQNGVTLLSGDGGTGKSTLAMQLAVALATGTPWLGIEVEKTNVLVLSAEDNVDEMHFRVRKILETIPEDHRESDTRVWVMDATCDLDPALATYDPKQGLRTTDLLSKIEKSIREKRIGLFIIDSAADAFNEEIVRTAVRGFIRRLNAIGCGVLLLAHPSAEGMRSGRGYSGSTHWNNAVRSRLYFTRAFAEDGESLSEDLRVLELSKSNRARTGQRMVLRWTEHGFVVDKKAQNLGGLKRQLKAEEVFINLLRLLNGQGQKVGVSQSSAYAPKKFADHPDNEGITKREFERAMQRLLSAGKIKIVKEGSRSRERQRLVVADEAEE